MATFISPSNHDDDDHNIPTATLALPSIATASASRRLPPPCWSPEETVALIDAYRDKWYSLRRGNLRANHWQEVADDVASKCPNNPPKTAVQCRHKMEKLRKRYRAEIQRAAAHGGVRKYSSSWVHFMSMYSMEKGPNNNPTPPSSSDEEEDDSKNSIKRINDLYNYNNQKGSFGNLGFEGNGGTPGVRIKIPGRVGTGPSVAKVYTKFDEIGVQNSSYSNPRFANSIAVANGVGSSKVVRDGFVSRGEMGKRAGEVLKKNDGDGGVGEVVAAIQAMGEGFMRIEKVKMDMVRQVEEMRMEMELKRTEMILESQQRIVDAFAKAISERSTKRAKRMPNSPEMLNWEVSKVGAFMLLDQLVNFDCKAASMAFSIRIVLLLISSIHDAEERGLMRFWPNSWFDRDGVRPIDVASAYGFVEMVRELLILAPNPAEICCLPGKDCKSAIHHASINGRVDVLDELMEKCPDCIRDVTSFGETALHLAVKYYKFEVFKSLLQWLERLGIMEVVNSKDKDGNTALHYAASRKQLEVVELLLDGNATTRNVVEVNAKNSNGLTAMDLLKFLIESSSDSRLKQVLQDASGSYVVVPPPVPVETSLEVPIAPSVDRKKPKGWAEMIEFFKFNYERDSASELCNALLVVAALFVTLAFQAIINLPSHIFPDDDHSSGDQYSQVTYLAGTTCLLFASIVTMDFLTTNMPFKREMFAASFSLRVCWGCSLGNSNLSSTAKWLIYSISFLVISLRWIPNLLTKIRGRRNNNPNPSEPGP
ncbi:hypothetical protein BUALT_Bualt19G0024700 [Buddleja alternifolia]|uniref:Myb-like domain-containing protein n=1 Tax=Buddleja alternifolia TaxID=168488 RepID=A0AAV6W1X7_9LAMI|nr:hypothetical protein BUALT_Bualt19G0024700 [Buddleja alternifolia]